MSVELIFLAQTLGNFLQIKALGHRRAVDWVVLSRISRKFQNFLSWWPNLVGLQFRKGLSLLED